MTYIAVDAKVRKAIICCKRTVKNDDGGAVLYSPEVSNSLFLSTCSKFSLICHFLSSEPYTTISLISLKCQSVMNIHLIAKISSIHSVFQKQIPADGRDFTVVSEWKITRMVLLGLNCHMFYPLSGYRPGEFIAKLLHVSLYNELYTSPSCIMHRSLEQ